MLHRLRVCPPARHRPTARRNLRTLRGGHQQSVSFSDPSEPLSCQAAVVSIVASVVFHPSSSSYVHPETGTNCFTDVSTVTPSTTPTGTLCNGVNFAQSGTTQPLPVSTGAYNYRKVALANTPTAVYEVECHMAQASGTITQTQQNVYSLEACMDMCNQAGPSSCLVAYWTNTTNTHQCQLYNGQYVNGLGAPNSFIGNGVRTARLLTDNSPTVIDATYLLAPGYDLGLCGGSNQTYYDRTFVGVYYTTSGNGGPLIQASRNDIWFITCAGYSYYGTAALTAINVASYAPTYGISTAPQTADDCARLCEDINANSGYSGSTGCRLWEFYSLTGSTAPSGSNQGCNLYSNRPAAFTQTATSRPGVLAAGFLPNGNFATGASGLQNYKKRSLPPGVGLRRRHPRDALAESDHIIADHIIPFYG